LAGALEETSIDEAGQQLEINNSRLITFNQSDK
jgi:hypothetical protein